MKKIVSIIIALSLVLSTVAFADTKKPVPAPIKAITVKVDGKDIKWPIVISKVKPKISTPKPYMQGETVMVPLKPVAASVGYKVTLKGKAVTVASGTAKTTFVLSATKAVVNGTEKALQIPAVLKSNAVYVPTELLTPMFGFTNQDWFADTKTLAVYSQFAKQDLWTRLYNSNRYERGTKIQPEYGDSIIVKGRSGLGSFNIHVDKNPDEKYELTIRVFCPTYEVRQELKKVLMVAYPTEWEKVYDLYMKTEREEIHELNFDGENEPGTYNKYYDTRHFFIVKTFMPSPKTIINIGFSGVKYQEQPTNPKNTGGFAPSPYLQDDIKYYRLNEY